ncbi:unnamed protein product [Rhizophagus irregularis]|uniref:Uncharacterized protein n=1 Tax=Rhizophagus irregularis TaxID=588596 RepID=A0A915ZUS3_9GLOM|nr:unnamed protein product [Rhizophagus irregularis]
MSTQHNVDDLSQWTSSNFEELEKILHDLIPHIRWFQIPAKVFWRKVNQFEPIFPKQLYKDIMGYHIDPDTPPINTILPLRPGEGQSMKEFSVKSTYFKTALSKEWVKKKMELLSRNY